MEWGGSEERSVNEVGELILFPFLLIAVYFGVREIGEVLARTGEVLVRRSRWGVKK